MLRTDMLFQFKPQTWLAGFQLCFGDGADAGLAPLRYTIISTRESNRLNSDKLERVWSTSVHCLCLASGSVWRQHLFCGLLLPSVRKQGLLQQADKNRNCSKKSKLWNNLKLKWRIQQRPVSQPSCLCEAQPESRNVTADAALLHPNVCLSQTTHVAQTCGSNRNPLGSDVVLMCSSLERATLTPSGVRQSQAFGNVPHILPLLSHGLCRGLNSESGKAETSNSNYQTRIIKINRIHDMWGKQQAKTTNTKVKLTKICELHNSHL